jgi:phosphocarrier protein
MIQREVKITNNSGLHARPATFFIQKANTYRSGVWVVKDDRKVSAKSPLGVLSIGIAKGMTITLVADGEDEQAAIDGLVELIETGFND